MNKITFCILLSLVVLTASIAQADHQDHIPCYTVAMNASFEGGTGDWVAGGSMNEEITHTADGALKWTFSERGYPEDGYVLSPPIPVGDGDKLAFSLWARGSGANFVATIRWYDTNGRQLYMPSTAHVVIYPGTWRNVIVEGTAPASASEARVGIEAESYTPWETGNVVRIDDVIVRKSASGTCSYLPVMRSDR